MIVIRDVNVYGMPASSADLKSIAEIFKSSIKLGGMKEAVKVVGDQIKFDYVKDDKWIISANKNKIHLAAGDARIERYGKDILESDRITEEQYNICTDIILNKIKTLGYNASIAYQEFKNDVNSLIPLVKDKEIVGSLPKPTAFPTKE